ncbi:MAG: hypothetical protein IV100_11440 [Myxococcales bacterium]|nr:hypothetical protein [Myxococcales bacterium]
MMPSLHARRSSSRILTLALLSTWLTACEPDTTASSDVSSTDTAPSDSVSLVACTGDGACTNVGEIECKTAGAETRVCSVDPLSGCLRWSAWAACPPAPDKCRTSVCQTGIGCALQFVPCSDSNMCTIDTCTPATGCVFTPSPVMCDDGNPCTTDACTPAGCTNVPNAGACDDGNACTQKDRCSKGYCVGGSPTKCGAADACHEAGICDPTTGLCDAPVRPNGTACSDLAACTTSDVCINGTCVGTPVECKAGPCSNAGCDPLTGLCQATPAADGTACSDGDACTQSDLCQDGDCVGSSPVLCAAPGPCSVAMCDSATGQCVTEAVANGGACSDGLACTVGDVCVSGDCEPGPCPLGFLCAGGDPCACAPGYFGPGCSGCLPGFGSASELVVTSNVGFLSPALLADPSALVGLAGPGPYSIYARLGLLADGSVFAASGTNPAHVVPPAAQSGVTQLAASFTHAIALKADGTVIGWGQDYYNAHVIPPLPGPAVAVATGGSHSAVLLADGNIILWGGLTAYPLPAPFLTSLAQGGFTAVAIGSTSNIAALKADGSVLTPHWPVTQTWTQVVAIAAGFNQILALTSGGAVLAVGNSPYGEANVPPEALSGVVAIAAAGHHSLALKADGSVVGWGRNYEGQLNLPVGPVGATRIFATGFASYIEFGGCELDDECADGTAVCDPNATCVNTLEGYDCVCDPGFAFDGTTCALDCATSEDGTACDDGDPCTTEDACDQGTCSGVAIVCAALGPCVIGASCQPDPEFGYACVTTFAPEGSSCEDGDLCTAGDVCKKGGCQPGLPILCPDGAACELDPACDPSTGECVGTPAPDGTACEDGAECTVGDTCFDGLCTAGACALNQDCTSLPTCACANGYVGADCDACAPGFTAVSRPLEWGVAPPFTALNSIAEGVTALHGAGIYRAALTTSGSVVVDAELWNPLAWVPAAALTGVSKVVINGTHALALKNGGVIAWGSNGHGQTTVPLAATTGVIDVAVLTNACLALLDTGEVIGWGQLPFSSYVNLLNGSVGPIASIEGVGIRAGGLRPDGQVENVSLATAGTWTGIVAISGGGGHLLGLDQTGRVRCNGDNGHGQCVVPTAAESGVVAIAAGRHHSVALKADGTVITWGKGVPGAQEPPVLPAVPAGIDAAGDSSYAMLQLCEDIDECATGLAECSPLAVCTNTVGSYDCTCMPPYVGDGFECAPAGCQGVSDGTYCDDGDLCTDASTCQAGACVGTPRECPSAGPCEKAGVCDPATGVCSAPTAAPDGSLCEDGNRCTKGDICKAGLCLSSVIPCGAPGPCQAAGVCDPETGLCSFKALSDGALCSDGDPCTAKDACKAGECIAGAALVCPAAAPCQEAGICKAEGDVAICVPGPPSPNGTPCNDENLCTDKDACKSGTCVGTERLCSPSEPCLVKGTCNPNDGKCSFPTAPDGTACEDGDPCTGADTCKLGICQPGKITCP